MGVSQFVQFTSSDVAGPGPITGAAGSLLTILDSCLVTGYAGHTLAAQWTKPTANAGNIGCYKQGAGAGLSLLINDNGPNVTSTFKEAWAVGWESIAGIGAPVGTGGGQFPIPAQLLTTGHVVWRKSASADAVPRFWRLFADSSTFYLFMATGDTAGTYLPVMFGDIFSFAGSGDAYRCMIIGRGAENDSTRGANSNITVPYGTDQFDVAIVGTAINTPGAPAAEIGHFIARTYSGPPGSVAAAKHFDIMKAPGCPGGNSVYINIPMAGVMQTPNGPDNSFYLSPVQVSESVGILLRGRLRGLYQVCHTIASFADGQVFSGGGDYAGKTFQVVTKFLSGGFCAIETSATVETN